MFVNVGKYVILKTKPVAVALFFIIIMSPEVLCTYVLARGSDQPNTGPSVFNSQASAVLLLLTRRDESLSEPFPARSPGSNWEPVAW